jgi:type IV pilus assembly protein PilA
VSIAYAVVESHPGNPLKYCVFGRVVRLAVDLLCQRVVMRARRHASQGFTLIELLIAVAIIGIIAAIAVPALLGARISGNEASAIGSIRAINAAETAYATSAARGGFADRLSTLQTPCGGSGPGFLSMDLSFDPTFKSGYIVTLQASAGSNPGPADCNGTPSRTGFYTSAIPRTVGVTGRRGFASNSINAVWQNATGVAPVEPFTSGPTVSPVQ